MQVARTWHIAAYVDQYRFPWLRFAVPRPTSGVDVRLVVEHEPRLWLRHYLQVRTETQGAGATVVAPSGRRVDGIRRETRRSLRWHGSFVFSRALTLRSRLEGVWAAERSVDPEPPSEPSPGAESPSDARFGVFLSQDVRWTPHPSLAFEARLAAFDTDDYATRVFAYEYDLLYSFTVPALQGRGRRSYVLVRAQPSARWTVEAKYAVTRYRGVDAVGSGGLKTPGDRIREIRLQVRWRLR
jgi:hypothetical protein